MNFIYSFDWKVFQFVESYIWHPVLDVIMTVITTLGDGGLIWIACAICLLISKKYRKVGAMVACGLIFSLIFTDGVVKPLVARPRPFDFTGWPDIFNYPDLIDKPTSLSFPSGHTSSSFGAAVPMLIAGNKKFSIPAVILAFLIGCSRVYIHVHYASDVIAGCLLGIVYGIAAYYLVTKLIPLIAAKIKARKKKEIIK